MPYSLSLRRRVLCSHVALSLCVSLVLAVGSRADEQQASAPQDRSLIMRTLQRLAPPSTPSSAPAPAPSWIWAEQTSDDQTVWFCRDIQLDETFGDEPLIATLYLYGDDSPQAFINGQRLSLRSTSSQRFSYRVAHVETQLKRGRNTIAISCHNGVSFAGVAAVLELDVAGKLQRWISDTAWRMSTKQPAGWPRCDTSADTWSAAHVIGPAGMKPWGHLVGYPTQRIPTPPADLAPQLQVEFDWLVQDRHALRPTGDASTGNVSTGDVSTASVLASLTRAHHDKTAEYELTDAQQQQWHELDDRLKQSPADASTLVAALDLYLAVRQLKRDAIWQHPRLDFDEILFVKGLFPGSLHEQSHRLSKTAVPGGGLFTLSGLSPAGELREVTSGALPSGSYWRPDLSFDGRRVLFCYKPAGSGSFDIYEVHTDGSELRQLTDDEFDDLDPIYLPSGDILFSSTRGQTWVRCNPESRSFVLCTADADGANTRIISHNSEPDWTPSLLDDGRVLFTRWEYTDRALWRLQKLWTVHPNGSSVNLFWGNHSEKPDCLVEARQIPGTNRVVFAGVGHHQFFQGSLGILDASEGIDYPHGLDHLTPEVAWPEVEADRDTGAFKSPYPLGDDLYLVSYGHDSNAFRRGGADFGLYLLDAAGNKELVYRDPNFNSWYAMPLRPRRRPQELSELAVHADIANPGDTLVASLAALPAEDLQTADDHATGVLFNPNVYEGLAGVPLGAIKHFRVIEIDYKTYSGNREHLFQCPPISVHFAESVKRVLGTAPVEPDGSICVQVPSGRALYFQLLDENYRALQSMRSFVGVQPGEVRSCTGCHETDRRAPAIETHPALALGKPVAQLTPPPWGDETVGYQRFVQPALDRYCVRCHRDGEEGGEALDLTYRKTKFFAEPYLTLIDREIAGVYPSEPAYWGARSADVYTGTEAGEYLSPQSRLVDYCSSGEHYDVRLDAESQRKLTAWVDANGPFLGREEVMQRFPNAPDSLRP